VRAVHHGLHRQLANAAAAAAGRHTGVSWACPAQCYDLCYTACSNTIPHELLVCACIMVCAFRSAAACTQAVRRPHVPCSECPQRYSVAATVLSPRQP
jgi:hypothetical protein